MTTKLEVKRRKDGSGLRLLHGGRELDLNWPEIRELHQELTVRLYTVRV